MELLTNYNTQRYHYLTLYYTSLICLTAVKQLGYQSKKKKKYSAAWLGFTLSK